MLKIALRITLGCLFFYAGISKILNPAWTSEGYLSNAKSFTSFYNWLTSPQILPIVNFVNEYALLLLGISLILGLFVRLSGIMGAILMLLYYLALDFPYPNPNSFIIDQHIIYILVLLYLSATNAGNRFGLDKFRNKKS